MSNNSLQEALTAASWKLISWETIAAHLPIKVYATHIYPYSHKREEDVALYKITNMTFHYRKGSMLTRPKGKTETLQEVEELVCFNDDSHGCVMMIKNIRAHLAEALRPIPSFEAERLHITKHEVNTVRWDDYRPSIEKYGKKQKYGRIIHYENNIKL